MPRPDFINMQEIARGYMDRIVPPDNSMKVLLLDASTTRMVSIVMSQSELLRRGVFLVQTIDAPRTAMTSMRCVIFVRPNSLTAVMEEIGSGRYREYVVIFTSGVSATSLDMLAGSDRRERVVHVEECFMDWAALHRDLVMVSPASSFTAALSASRVSSGECRRIAEGIASLMVALRRKPTVRIQQNSVLAKRVITDLDAILRSDAELYDYKARETVMLIVDRSDDPLTPLLSPWTYQAMLHEMITLDHHTLRLPDAPPGDVGLVFNPMDDSFFAKVMFMNWGEVCQQVIAFVDECKKSLNIDRGTASMEEIKAFLSKLPQTKQLAGSVTKHTDATSFLSQEIKKRKLLEVSMLEQDMSAATSSPNDHWSRLAELARGGGVGEDDLLRLAMIYHLRYEKAGAKSRTEELQLIGRHIPTFIRKLRDYYGSESPTGPLFPGGNVMQSVVSFVKGLSDERNIYTQHEPLLRRQVLALGQGKLDLQQYPVVLGPAHTVPRDVVIVQLGGSTYAEAALVHRINEGWAGEKPTSVPLPDINVLLVATGMINTSQFVQMIDDMN